MTTSAGAPLPGANVHLFSTADQWLAYDETDASGNYSIQRAAGTYKLYVESNESGQHNEVYNNKATLATADLVTLSTGTTDIDFQLAGDPTVSGTVTTSAGTPLAGAYVHLFSTTDTWLAYDETDASGNYSIQRAAGSYKLYVESNEPGQLNEVYNNKPTLATADLVTLAAGPPTDIDFQLAAEGANPSVSGTVTTSGGAPLAGASVHLFSTADQWLAYDETDASGNYSIQRGAGNYKLYVESNEAGQLNEIYNDKPTLATADLVTLSTGATDIDLQLAAEGLHSPPTGFAPGDIHSGVSIFPATSNSLASAITDHDESTYAREMYPSGFIEIDYGQPVTVLGVLLDQEDGTRTYSIGGFGKSSASHLQLLYWPEGAGPPERSDYEVAYEVNGYAEHYRFNLPAPITARYWMLRMDHDGGPYDGSDARNTWHVNELHLSAERVAFLAPSAEQQRGLCRTGHVKCPGRFEKDPVNTATGNFVTEATDLTLPGRGLGFAFTRTYNSVDPAATVLGPGWRHSYDARLIPAADSAMTFQAEDGVQLLYAPAGSGNYVTPNGSDSSLRRLVDGTYELTRRDQVRYRFDAGGVLTSMADRNGNQLSLAYASGRLATITDTVGRTITLGYTDGKLTSLSGPPSRSVSYGYDAAGRLASVTDATGETWAYAYDASNRLLTVTDPNDHAVVTNEYGADGRVSAQTDATGHRGTFAWNPATQTSTYTDANDGTWTDVYDLGRLVSYTDPFDNASTYTYDADFNVTSVTDPRGHMTTTTYDEGGNLLARTAPEPLGHTESWTYTARNDVATYTDARDNTTTSVYDAAGNLIRVEAPEGAVTEFGRDTAGTGLLVSLTDPRDKVTTFGYDAQANLTSTTSPLGHTATMTYDAAGRLLTSVDPRGNASGANPADYITTFTYDAADRPLTVTDPLGHVTTNTYDPTGNLITVTDPNDHTTTYGYDAANRLLTVTDAASEVTAYAYDDVGNLVTRTDANDHVTTYAYDLANRLSTTTDPLDHVWTLTYDDAGNPATRTDANGQTTIYAHDALNRLTGTAYEAPATPDVSLAYDANGNVTTMTDGAGTETYAYDDLDRLTGVTRGTSVFSYAYDLASNLTSRTYPDTTVTAYTFDDDGRMATATSGGAATTYGYDPAGNVTTIATPDGYTARYAYDRAGRLAEVAHRTDTDLLSHFTYQLDASGNRTAITTRLGTVSYHYDDLNRLTGACWAASCPWGAGSSPAPCLDCGSAVGVTRPADPTPPDPADTFLTWTYDPVGNRLTEATHAGITTYAYDIADRLTSVTPPGQSAIGYTYDDNGNQLTAGTDSFAWDAADRMVSANAGGATETYTYAGDGRRLSVTAGGSTTSWWWDLAHPLPMLALERDGTGTVTRRSTYGLGRIATVMGGQTAYHHAEGLGSLVDVTDPTGDPVAWVEYAPFGAVRTTGLVIGGTTVPFGFTGEFSDSTGLLHLRARQYDPGTGRFLSTDPKAPLLGDPYVASHVYALNAPCNRIDPSGMASCPGVQLASALLLGALGTAEAALAGASVAVAPSVVGEAALLPAHLATFWAMGQAISNIEQAGHKPCEEVDVWNPFEIFGSPDQSSTVRKVWGHIPPKRISTK